MFGHARANTHTHLEGQPPHANPRIISWWPFLFGCSARWQPLFGYYFELPLASVQDYYVFTLKSDDELPTGVSRSSFLAAAPALAW